MREEPNTSYLLVADSYSADDEVLCFLNVTIRSAYANESDVISMLKEVLAPIRNIPLIIFIVCSAIS